MGLRLDAPHRLQLGTRTGFDDLRAMAR